MFFLHLAKKTYNYKGEITIGSTKKVFGKLDFRFWMRCLGLLGFTKKKVSPDFYRIAIDPDALITNHIARHIVFDN